MTLFSRFITRFDDSIEKSYQVHWNKWLTFLIVLKLLGIFVFVSLSLSKQNNMVMVQQSLTYGSLIQLSCVVVVIAITIVACYYAITCRRLRFLFTF